MKILAVVPLRLASTRVPRKIFADIGGKSLALRTLAQVHAALGDAPDTRILAAVDSEETRTYLLKKFPSLEVIMTPPELPSGTDRVFAAVNMYLALHPESRASLRGILNIQGDMPFAGLEGLRQAAGFYRSASDADLQKYGMITLGQPWPRDMKLADPASVKVIADQSGGAIYFSRFPIPYSRKQLKPAEFRNEKFDLVPDLHIGLYGYTLESLSKISAHAPIGLEQYEGLEQLRALWLGIKILVLRTQPEAHEDFRGIDTPKDLLWARRFTKGARKQKRAPKSRGRR